LRGVDNISIRTWCRLVRNAPSPADRVAIPDSTVRKRVDISDSPVSWCVRTRIPNVVQLEASNANGPGSPIHPAVPAATCAFDRGQSPASVAHLLQIHGMRTHPLHRRGRRVRRRCGPAPNLGHRAFINDSLNPGQEF
jgi:hypothetical protein